MILKRVEQLWKVWCDRVPTLSGGDRVSQKPSLVSLPRLTAAMLLVW
ncbi:hypothetical protein [Nostoc sp. CHAB 5715]|nr:hypothetical protein [Nostoc sp. CHAB 5715]MCC5622671.1 hypothetical protein [Nostoc sp. CHAB 5715]